MPRRTSKRNVLPTKEPDVQQPAMPSVADQLGTDDPHKQAALVATYKQFANTRPVVVTVYYDARVAFVDLRPFGGDVPFIVLQEVLVLAQQKVLRDIQEQAQQAQQAQENTPRPT